MDEELKRLFGELDNTEFVGGDMPAESFENDIGVEEVAQAMAEAFITSFLPQGRTAEGRVLEEDLRGILAEPVSYGAAFRFGQATIAGYVLTNSLRLSMEDMEAVKPMVDELRERYDIRGDGEPSGS